MVFLESVAGHVVPRFIEVEPSEVVVVEFTFVVCSLLPPVFPVFHPNILVESKFLIFVSGKVSLYPFASLG